MEVSGVCFRVGTWSAKYGCKKVKQQCVGGPGSVDGIAIGYGLDVPGIEPRCGRDFPHLSIPALESIQPPVQWVTGLSRE